MAGLIERITMAFFHSGSVERLVDRRTFLGHASLGIGATALAGMMQRTLLGSATAGAVAINPLSGSRPESALSLGPASNSPALSFSPRPVYAYPIRA